MTKELKAEMKATIRYAGERDLFIATSSSGHAQVLDADGARRSAASPLELLLLALGACTAVDVASILEKKRARLSAYRVDVTATRRDEYPRHLTAMNVHHVLHGSNISEQGVTQAIELSETKYCSVAATLKPTVEIISTYEIHNEESGD